VANGKREILNRLDSYLPGAFCRSFAFPMISENGRTGLCWTANATEEIEFDGTLS
jgi:hypothetical protein